MKELMFHVVKWWLVIIVAGFVFYFVYPKYKYIVPRENPRYVFRCNKITGKVHLGYVGSQWLEVGRAPSDEEQKSKP